MPESESQPTPTEPGTNREIEAPLTLEALPTQLGFVESPPLMQLREQFLKIATEDPDSARELAIRYRLLAEEVVEEHTGAAYGKAQIGLIIAVGLNWRDAGSPNRYLEQLRDAREYAGYEG